MKNVFFSIIIPVYNVDSTFMDECIDSITNQTFKDYEVIIVDDGSRTECGKHCDQYAIQNDKLKVVHIENAGVSNARNVGIKTAVGDWIMFVDADDWLDVNALSLLYERLKNSSCDILLFNAIKEYKDSSKPLNYGLENDTSYFTSEVAIKEMLYRRAMQPPNVKGFKGCPIYYSCDKAYRREFLLGNNLEYPVGIPKSEDKVFILKCFMHVKELHYIDSVLYHYRINNLSVCNRYLENIDMDRIGLCEVLSIIAKQMDFELSKIRGYKVNVIYHDFMHFVFGISSDVLLLKFYHEENPNCKTRRKDALRFLDKSPFKESIRVCTYKELPNNAKLKKLLLSHKFVSLFCSIKKKRQGVSGYKKFD